MFLLILLFQWQNDHLDVATFNLESGEADITFVSGQISTLKDVDIWGFAEVYDGQWAAVLENALERDPSEFESILGASGREDRLLIIYRTSDLELLAQEELDEMNIEGKVRAPLLATFRHKTSGTIFHFMVNHLYRGNAEGRKQQAIMLNQWARKAPYPVIAVGDFNFDFELEGKSRDAGFDEFVKDDVFKWVRPQTLYKTHTHPHYNTVLDFVFVSGVAKNWSGESEILTGFAGVKDDLVRSDHEPVFARFLIPSSK